MTSAQRVRLVVALGILNLILASFAFAVGIGAPRQPEGQIAQATAAPSPALTPSSPNPPPDLGSPGPTLPPSGEPTAPPSPGPSGSVEPSVIPVPTGDVIVAERPSGPPAGGPTPAATNPSSTPGTHPTPKPKPTATPATQPTPKPTQTAHPTPIPVQTTNPTPKPTPTPKPPKPTSPPAAERAHPPCPGDVSGPPGHNKTQPGHEPCGKGKGSDGDHGKGGSDGAVIIVLPLALSALVAGGRTRVARSLRRRRLPR